MKDLLRTADLTLTDLETRGDEVVAEVIDRPQSAVFRQAANRLPTVQAALCALIEGYLTGRSG